MKILVLDGDGVNTGCAVRSLLLQKGHDVKAVSVFKSAEGKVTTRKLMSVAAKFGVTVEKTKAVPATAEDLSWADKIVCVHPNIKLIKRRLGEAVIDSSVSAGKFLNLDVAPGFQVKKDKFEDYLKGVLDKVNALSL